MQGMEMSEMLSRLVIFVAVLLLSISIHEAGHAWMSHKWGDDTAYLLGRVTLNPAAHTDPIGTLVLPILGFISASMGGFALLGWGKPCPVNPRKWTNYKKANFWVSIAGVLGNLILAVISFTIIKALMMSGIWQGADSGMMKPVKLLLVMMLTMNVSLIVFNLLPFPPLDGGKILENFLPSSVEPIFRMLEQYGIILLWILVLSGFTRYIFAPVFGLIEYLLYL